MIKLIYRDLLRLLPYYWRGWLYAIFLGALFVIITDSWWKGLLLAVLVSAHGIIVAVEHVAYDQRMLGMDDQ